MNDYAWIRELKVGDKVIVSRGGYNTSCYIDVVDRITPKGFIGVGGFLFRETGRLRGEGKRWITQATEEALEKIKQEKELGKCIDIMNDIVKNRRKLTYEQAVEISRIFESEVK